MLQKTTAFDAIDSALAGSARDTIAVIAAVVLGLLASLLGYKLSNATPKPKTAAEVPPTASPTPVIDRA